MKFTEQPQFFSGILRRMLMNDGIPDILQPVPDRSSERC